MIKKMIFHNVTLDQMAQLANQLAPQLRTGISICLWGDLGAGKTTFARYLLKAMDPSLQEVPSPTFTLIQHYPTPQGEVWHCDLYRLKTSEEIYELGLEDAFYTSICLIEWPEKIQSLLPSNRVDISIEISSNSTRTITFTPQGTLYDSMFSFHL